MNIYSLLFSLCFLNLATFIIPGGENVGLEINPKGVLVIGGYDVITNKTHYNPIKDSDILKGDLIIRVNGNSIENIQELVSNLKTDNEKASLSIKRNNQDIIRTLKLVKTSNANTFKTGLLVKERILGIGTMTFYDPISKTFGALGHQLMDQDFATISDINSGCLYSSTVSGINKSKIGNVGEILATIDESNSIGKIYSNTQYGVFGHYDTCPDKDALEVALQDEIKLGYASIYTTLSENVVKEYAIEILALEKQNKISTKGITFKITDKDLLNKTGGIVQGMSGSPIIQNNKIIGAVTHVLIDSVKKGYGIYMESMIKAS